MGKKSAPPPPDYAKQAQATAASNQEAQTRADWANRPTINTPWGTESWQASAGVDPATGQPITQWTQNTALTPQSQATLDATMSADMQKAQLAQSQFGRVSDAMSTPFDWNNMQAMGQVPQAGNLQAGNLDPSQYQTQGAGQGIMAGLNTQSLGAMPTADDQGRQRIEQGLFARLDPQHQQAQAGLESKLSNMGLTRGSAQWNQEMQRLQDQQSRENYDALQTAGQEQQRQFGMQMQGRQQGFGELQGTGQFQNQAQQQAFEQAMAQNAQNFGQQATAGAQNFGQQAQAGQQNFQQQLQASNYANQVRQQQIAEQMQQRTMPLNELNALLTGTQVGQLQTPDFAKSQNAGGVDYSGAANQQYGASMDAYNAGQAQRQGMMSGVTAVAGAALMAF